jgi:hypothetical protein
MTPGRDARLSLRASPRAADSVQGRTRPPRRGLHERRTCGTTHGAQLASYIVQRTAVTRRTARSCRATRPRSGEKERLQRRPLPHSTIRKGEERIPQHPPPLPLLPLTARAPTTQTRPRAHPPALLRFFPLACARLASSAAQRCSHPFPRRPRSASIQALHRRIARRRSCPRTSAAAGPHRVHAGALARANAAVPHTPRTSTGHAPHNARPRARAHRQTSVRRHCDVHALLCGRGWGAAGYYHPITPRTAARLRTQRRPGNGNGTFGTLDERTANINPMACGIAPRQQRAERCERMRTAAAVPRRAVPRRAASCLAAHVHNCVCGEAAPGPCHICPRPSHICSRT